MSTIKIIELNEQNICRICQNQLGKYSCPRCNILYCSVTCYRSERHLECSESFYKECFVSELRSPDCDPEMRTRMTEILERFHQQNDMETNQDLDSDDDEELPDLADRLRNVDLNDADRIWSLLGEDERQEFEAFVQSGDASKIVPIWMPWWENKIKQKLVQDVDEQNCYNYKEICPALLSNIKPFSELSKLKPAECVKYNLINILASYVCVVRYFNGDHFQFSKEAVYLLTNLSVNFNSNKNLDSFTSAIDSVYYLCLTNDWISVDADHKTRMYNDVRNIAEGPEESNKTYYMKVALSDMHRLMAVSKKAKATPFVNKLDNEFSKRFLDNELPENKIVSKESLNSYIKKVEYYLSFITSFENVFQ